MKRTDRPDSPNRSDDSIKAAKMMAKEYKGARARCELYPQKRPTFMKQMKVNLDDYADTGVVKYCGELESHLCASDVRFLHQYVNDMMTVWTVEKAMETLSDEMTRRIAVDTIYHGVKCKELQTKYGLKERAIQARKAEAIRAIAGFIM